jgi:predicted O-methyltransferase YrrM
VDVDAFAAALPARFGGDLRRADPPDARFGGLVQRVPGMSTEHALAVLDLAVDHLPEDECYLEVGSFRGRSVIGALRDHPGRRGTAVESFAEFGVDPVDGRRALAQALVDFGCEDRVSVEVGDAFRLLQPGLTRLPVGVYFYDGAHSRVAQYLGLALAEPLLADHALVIVDDASWRQVRSATDRYLARHRGYRVVADIAADEDFDARWCNGLLVLEWERPLGWRAPGGWHVEWRRLTHLWLLAPMRTAAYALLRNRPRLASWAGRLYLHGGTRVARRP